VCLRVCVREKVCALFEGMYVYECYTRCLTRVCEIDWKREIVVSPTVVFPTVLRHCASSERVGCVIVCDHRVCPCVCLGARGCSQNGSGGRFHNALEAVCKLVLRVRVWGTRARGPMHVTDQLYVNKSEHVVGQSIYSKP